MPTFLSWFFYLPELNDKSFSELSSSTQIKFKYNVENIRLILYSKKSTIVNENMVIHLDLIINL
jgi:hypothetical protein